MPATPQMGRRKSLYDQYGQIRTNLVDTEKLPKNTVRRSKSMIRWLVLFLSCFGMFGNYYCYDNPTALSSALTERLNLSSFKYNSLYSIYSLPNTVLPLAGGVFVDRIGVNTCIIMFTALLVGGQSLFAFGVSVENYWIILGGRFFFGLGGECLCVASSSLLAAWFKNKEMAFAMAVNLSIARLGSVANDNISPLLKDNVSLSFAIWVGAMVMGFCLFLTLILVFVDNKWVAEQKRKGYEVEDVSTGEIFEWKDIFTFKWIFWLMTISCLVVYGCVLPFNNIAGKYFQENWDYSESEANALLGIPFLISAISAPFLGGLVDKFGQRAYLFLWASICLAFAHGMMAFVDDEVLPIPWLVIVGSAYSIYAAAVWPGVALVVPEIQLGTAYGIITSIQNIGLTIFPIVVGFIRDKTGTYTNVEIFFMSLACCGIISACFLILEDRRTGGRLNLPNLKKKDSVADTPGSIQAGPNNYAKLEDSPDPAEIKRGPAESSINVNPESAAEP